jgi:hypothetical protein
MIVIAEFYAKYSSTVPESELRIAGDNLLRFAEDTAHEYYAERYDQHGIAITVRVEIGSTRVWITVKALGKAFLLYAAIRQGIDYFVQDSQNLARLVIPGIPAVLKIPPQPPEYHERRLGLPGQLRRLFEKVRRGELSADEATNQAVLLYQRQNGDAIREIPALKDRLASEFRKLEPSTLRPPGKQRSYPSGESAERRSVPRRARSLPQHREPVIAPLPGTGFRRRRRTGIIATRDPETGDIRVTPY